MKSRGRYFSAVGRVALATLLSATALSTPGAAQTIPELAKQIGALQAELAQQKRQASDQQDIIAEQQRQLGQLRDLVELDRLMLQSRGRGLSAGQETPPVTTTATGKPAARPGSTPADADAAPPEPPTNPSTFPEPAAKAAVVPERPVGIAPPMPDPRVRAQVLAVPQELGVLTPPGLFVIDPQLEYVTTSNDRLVFRGFELIPGLQVGLIEASKAERDTIVGTAAFRYGISRRLEAEVRVPFLSRNDNIEVVQQRDIGIVRQLKLAEDNLGDIELNFRYQLNRVRPLRPIWLAQLRIKSDTGKSPYEVGFDEFGVATGLATGSGFWAVQPGISFLLPSDPVVIFGGASYLWNIRRDVKARIGDAVIGVVDPGDAISANLGFGFALNPRFSYSLGYRHSYIVPTKSAIGDTTQRSSRLTVGQLSLGLSYRITQRQTLNVSFTIGVTKDAPDVGISIRMPFEFRLGKGG